VVHEPHLHALHVDHVTAGLLNETRDTSAGPTE
jgi:hypothetical protein